MMDVREDSEAATTLKLAEILYLTTFVAQKH